MELTQEQIDIISTVTDDTVDKVVINALAGSGKTTSLIELTKKIFEVDKHARVLYVVFNNNMAEEADYKFRENNLQVECRTAHGFALSQLKKKQHVNVIENINYSDYEQVKPVEYCNFVKVIKLLDIYCGSFLNMSDFIEALKKENYLETHVKEKFTTTEVNTFQKLYYYLIEQYKYTHNMYLKEFALNMDDIYDYDYLLFDEAQDADPYMLLIAEKLLCKKKYFVGDIHQQIYGWRGAINAMNKIENAKHFTLSNSFRFGNEISSYANEILSYKPSFKGRVNGVGSHEMVDNKETVLFRTNAAMIDYAYKKLKDNDNIKIEFQGMANSRSSDDFVEIYHDFLSLVRVLLEEGKNSKLIEDFNKNFRFSKVSAKIKKIQDTATKERITVKRYLQDQADYSCNFDNDIARYFTFFKENEYKIVDVLLRLRNSGDVENPEKEYNLITCHRSKGLEWDNVTIAGDEWSVDTLEEQNLLYVAVTRAKCNLNVESKEVREFIGMR